MERCTECGVETNNYVGIYTTDAATGRSTVNWRCGACYNRRKSQAFRIYPGMLLPIQDYISQQQQMAVDILENALNMPRDFGQRPRSKADFFKGVDHSAPKKLRQPKVPVKILISLDGTEVEPFDDGVWQELWHASKEYVVAINKFDVEMIQYWRWKKEALQDIINQHRSMRPRKWVVRNYVKSTGKEYLALPVITCQAFEHENLSKIIDKFKMLGGKLYHQKDEYDTGAFVFKTPITEAIIFVDDEIPADKLDEAMDIFTGQMVETRTFQWYEQ